MRKTSIVRVGHANLLDNRGGFVHRLPLVSVIALALAVLTAVTGCRTPQASEPLEESPDHSDHAELIALREGNVVKISFPGTPNLDTTQEIRRDGKIVLSLVGEVTAVGMTPAELEKEIVKLCSSQLVSKEVTVTVVSSSFP